MGQRGRLILLGVAGAAVIGLFVVLLNLADNAQPDPTEMRIELPDAFKD